MSHFDNKHFSTGLVSGATAACFIGPIHINYYDTLSFAIENCSAIPIDFKIIASEDEGRRYSNTIPEKALDNTDLTLRGKAIHVNAINGKCSYKFISFLGSATATISASDVNLVMVSKRSI